MTAALPKVVRYVAVSGLTWLIDFSVFAVLIDQIGYAGAMVVARIVALAFSFPSHRWLSFEAQGPASPRELISYLVLWATNMAFATGLILLLAQVSPSHPMALKLAVEVIVFVANFLILGRIFAPRNRHGLSR